MKEQFDLLFELQQIDSTIDDASKRLAGVDDGSAKRAELEQQRAELAEMEATLKQTNSQQLDKELELESTEEERAQKWSKAYGGSISDPKELASLEKKLEELQRRKDKLEDVLLELYDKSEQESRKVEQQRETVARLAKELDATVENFERVSAELEAAIADAQQQRTAIVEKLDEKLLVDYEGIRGKSGGLAVVAVNGSLCSGCRVSISVMLLEESEKGKKLVRCENCRRILHYSE